MLPGIIPQVNLEWDSSTNYHLPTIKRYQGKLYMWLAPSGPQLGGSKTPGTSEGSTFWQCLDEVVAMASNIMNENNWDNIRTPGRYFIHSEKDVTIGAPLNITSWWWLDVSVAHPGEGDSECVLQEATRHSTDENAGYALHRCYDNGTWGGWGYTYSQFSV